MEGVCVIKQEYSGKKYRGRSKYIWADCSEGIFFWMHSSTVSLININTYFQRGSRVVNYACKSCFFYSYFIFISCYSKLLDH